MHTLLASILGDISLEMHNVSGSIAKSCVLTEASDSRLEAYDPYGRLATTLPFSQT